MVPAALIVPPLGHVAPTAAVTSQMPMSGVISTVSNVVSVSSVANIVT